MAVKDDKVRKLVTVEKTMWAEIEDIRFEGRFKTESDVMRYLFELGIKAHNAKERRKK